MEQNKLDPVVKTVIVPCSPAQAFDAFTAGLQTWWPLKSHSVGLQNAVSCELECRLAGELFELTSSGEKHVWGTIQNWSPPDELTFSWHPGRTPETAQVIAVTFRGQGDGTRVTLTHGGWETLGDAAADTRKGYVTGWDYVLGQQFVGRFTI